MSSPSSSSPLTGCWVSFLLKIGSSCSRGNCFFHHNPDADIMFLNRLEYPWVGSSWATIWWGRETAPKLRQHFLCQANSTLQLWSINQEISSRWNCLRCLWLISHKQCFQFASTPLRAATAWRVTGWIGNWIGISQFNNHQAKPDKRKTTIFLLRHLTKLLVDSIESQKQQFEKSTLCDIDKVFTSTTIREFDTRFEDLNKAVWCDGKHPQIHSTYVWLQLLARILWSSQAGW